MHLLRTVGVNAAAVAVVVEVEDSNKTRRFVGLDRCSLS